MLSRDGCIETATPAAWNCRSWRHEGKCRLWRGACDFARVKCGLETSDTWTYVVLTFAQRKWKNWHEQYICGQPMWSAFRKRVCRLLKVSSIRYIQTWERHRKGGLHCNVTVEGEEFREFLKYQSEKIIPGFDPMPVNEILSPIAEQTGWGPAMSMAAIDGNRPGDMAGYLIKLARELTGAGIKCQIPIDAPPHFRRIRASNGLLPPINHGDSTGWLVQRPMSGNWQDEQARFLENIDVSDTIQSEQLQVPANSLKGELK